MLPERCRQLLTAYVDGELTARQRRAVFRLLRRSREARHLLRHLQTDSRTLRALNNTPALEVDLSPDILQAIRDRRLVPTAPPEAPAPRPATLPFRAPARHFPAWVGAAAAAAVLLAVGLGSFAYFLSGDRSTAPPVAQQQPPADEGPGIDRRPGPAPAPSGLAEHKPAPGETPKRPTPSPAPAPKETKKGQEKAPLVQVTPLVPDKKGHERPEPKKAPSTDDLRTAPPGEGTGHLARVDLLLPSLFGLHGLKNDDAERQQLAAELRKEKAFRVELLCRDTVKAADRLRSALTARSVGLIVDPGAQGRLKAPQWKTDFALFLEDVTPDEAVELLQKLGSDDRQAAKRPSELRFEGTVVLAPLGPGDDKELVGLMGVNPTQVLPRAPTGPLGTDVRRPLDEKTASQVADVLASPTRPGAKGAKGPARHALLMACSPRPRHGSAEVKRFLAGRKPLRPGALQLFIVLRGL